MPSDTETQNPQDEALRKKIENWWDDFNVGKLPSRLMDKLVLLVHSHTAKATERSKERARVEGQLTQIKKMRRQFERLAEYADFKEEVMTEYDDEIAQLTAVLERLSKEELG